jgi:hypothetical protein
VPGEGEDAHPTSVSFEEEDSAAIERSSSATTRISARSTASSSASSDDESDDDVDGGDDGCFPVPCDEERARLLRNTIQNSHIKFDDDSGAPIPPTAKAEAKDDFTQPIETLGDTFANTHSQTHSLSCTRNLT